VIEFVFLFCYYTKEYIVNIMFWGSIILLDMFIILKVCDSFSKHMHNTGIHLQIKVGSPTD